MTMQIIGGVVIGSLLLYVIAYLILIITWKVIAVIFSMNIRIDIWANNTIFFVTPCIIWMAENDLNKHRSEIPQESVHIFLGLFFGLFLCSFFQMLLTEYHGRKEKKQLEKELEISKRDAQIKELEIKQKQEEQAKWQLELDREIERERRLSEVRHESTIMAMRAQVALYAEYKEKGLSVEKEIFEMREKLLKMEGEENKAMLDEIKTTLDSLA